MVRVRAGISYAVTEAMDDGHCGLPTEELLSLAERLLEEPVELVRTALDLELADGTVVADTVRETACVFLAGLHRAERNIADWLVLLRHESFCLVFGNLRAQQGHRGRARASATISR
jgi:exodeoxyribonuclease V alpha subunit